MNLLTASELMQLETRHTFPDAEKLAKRSKLVRMRGWKVGLRAQHRTLYTNYNTVRPLFKNNLDALLRPPQALI